ncbi:hypothetical protein XELAEV_18038619mg [Xenopus laevis]|uniref:Uncharacterized protein n=1 Tax=Xenopus laevis TaxID=8355 RepID=A0A974H725_XENLA|nr:hypothetical protein XELAEV_18038619mg [Xenopus laevis]
MGILPLFREWHTKRCNLFLQHKGHHVASYRHKHNQSQCRCLVPLSTCRPSGSVFFQHVKDLAWICHRSSLQIPSLNCSNTKLSY